MRLLAHLWLPKRDPLGGAAGGQSQGLQSQQKSWKHRSFALARVTDAYFFSEGLLKVYCVHSTGMRKERNKEESSPLSSEHKGQFSPKSTTHFMPRNGEAGV